jgi:hypothetical protein
MVEKQTDAAQVESIVMPRIVMSRHGEIVFEFDSQMDRAVWMDRCIPLGDAWNTSRCYVDSSWCVAWQLSKFSVHVVIKDYGCGIIDRASESA